jgi:hypothetical protein
MSLRFRGCDAASKAREKTRRKNVWIQDALLVSLLIEEKDLPL